jgi:HK97 gp10 family phage protein
MTGVYSLAGFIAKLGAIEADMKVVDHGIIAKACEMVCQRAKEALGTYDFGWTPLQPETIARKVRGDSPLLETGELRASIEWNSSGNLGHVGSDSDKAVWMEFGTSKVPPRPFLMNAAVEMEEKIHNMAARAVVAALSGHGINSAEMRELLHLLHIAKEAFNHIAEAVKPDNLDDSKRNSRR